MSRPITEAWITRFQGIIDQWDPAACPADCDPRIYQAIYDSYLSMVDDLQGQLDRGEHDDTPPFFGTPTSAPETGPVWTTTPNTASVQSLVDGIMARIEAAPPPAPGAWRAILDDPPDPVVY